MKKVIWVLGIAVCLVLGTLLVSCGPPQEPDVWSDVTSVDQLNGTWRATESERMSFKEAMFMQFAQGDESQRTAFNLMWDSSGYGTLYGNINIDMTRTEIVTINAATPSETGTRTQTVAFSGGNINNAGVWDSIKVLLFEGSMPEGTTMNDANKSFSTWSYSYNNILSDYNADRIQINQNGNKIKITYDLGEVIYTKQ